jgi:hypothetical protein
MAHKDLTKGERFIWDWQHDRSGSFMALLGSAIAKADVGNRHKLSLGFPDEVEAMNRFQNEEGWWTEVEKKVSS